MTIDCNGVLIVNVDRDVKGQITVLWGARDCERGCKGLQGDLIVLAGVDAPRAVCLPNRSTKQNQYPVIRR